MQGFVEDAGDLETVNGVALRHRAERRELATASALLDDDPEIVTDGGRPGDPAAEARAVAGPGQPADHDRDPKRWTPPAGYEERGDGQQTVASWAFGGVR